MQRRTFLRLSAAGAVAVGGASLLGTWQANATEIRPLRTAPTTPFAVGVRQYNWMRGSRQVTTFVYYPAAGPAGGGPVNNAPVAPGVFPVCAYQHGLGGNPQGSMGHIRPLAAAGFIVPAPSMGRASINDTYNGNLARDNSEAITRTLALNTVGGDPLAGHIDTAVGVGMSGHSMGGMTTHSMLTAFPDSRIKAAIPMACIDMGNPSSSVKANTLYMHGDRDTLTHYNSARAAYAETPPTKAFLTFLGGDHGNYWGGTIAVRTFLDWMRWSLYGDLAARDRLPADATSPSTRWEFVLGAGQPTPPPTGAVNLVAQHSGKLAEIAGASTAAGAMLVQRGGNGGQNQQFEFVDTGDGHVRIKARHSGLVLQAASNTSGADITQQPDTNAASQQWRVTDHGGGVVSLVNRQSGLALDVWERSTADGARISQWNYTGNPNQRFTRRPA